MAASDKGMEIWALRYARLALAAAFLSAVASRFGLWQGHFSMARFHEFIAYTGEVNAFLPAKSWPFLAWAATLAETACGLTLLSGFKPRLAGFASAGLLFVFATAMAVSQGIKSPLDYSVYSASAAALLLALRLSR